jgi:MGT family glycosyltransferase
MRGPGTSGTLTPMSRFLLAALPAAGHVNPMLPVAAQLVARGHDVALLTGARYRDRVLATGADYLAPVHMREIDFGDLNAALPGRGDTDGLARFRFDMRELFIPLVAEQLADLEHHAARLQPDAVVAEPGFGGAARILDERHGLPFATVGISALMLPSRDVAPFGFGLPPARSAAARARNRVLAAALDRVVMRPVERDHVAMRDRLGAQPFEEGVFAAAVSPYLYLQPTVPSFEYPRSDLAEHVHFVGPLLPPAPRGAVPPAWWPELAARRPVVLVTQGTIATDPAELLRPALDAMAGRDVMVVAVTGGPDPAEVGPVPANARVERFVPFAGLMPHVSVLVSNGGYGGLHFALSHGVPLVAAGATEEKPELVARVNHAGVGVGLRRQRPRAEQLRAAVTKVLDDPSYAARAAAVRDEMAAHDGPETAARLLEELAATGAPVRRSEPRAPLAPLAAAA